MTTFISEALDSRHALDQLDSGQPPLDSWLRNSAAHAAAMRTAKTRLHGRGLGGELLWDALTRAVAASELAAARIVVVDAIDEASVRFYEHHGFIQVPGNDSRLVQKMSDVAAALSRK